MTDEELKNKCTERAKIFQQAMESCHSSSPIDCIEWFADRIADLEEKLANADYQLEGRDNEIRELKEQNEKLQNCWNCKKSFIRACTFGKKCEAKKKKCKEWEIKEK